MNTSRMHTGAELAVYALEQIGVRYTFGIPGVHNTELYDELGKSKRIKPVLVTHEMGAAFMADAVSRTGDSIGTLMIVPAAGTTHAMSGIGEAFLDGIPMLIITGGVRRDSGRHYQLHQVDQMQLVKEITKKAYVIRDHASILPTIFEAYELATSGTPGPVFIEIPVEIQLFKGEAQPYPFVRKSTTQRPLQEDIAQAVELLLHAKRPGLYLGWGARDATQEAIELAEKLGAPVATTVQGLSVFPANHALHVGVGFGPAAVPAAENAFKDCDCLLAVGARFGELATGSYSLPVPANLIHIDINPEVFSKNYPARVTIASDAREALSAINDTLTSKKFHSERDPVRVAEPIRADKERYRAEWLLPKQGDRVSPGHFFKILREKMDIDAFLVVDDGNHTFLSLEQFPVYQSKHFISPTDFNAMGYAVPAAIGVKISHPDKQVVGIVGDGGFLMTGLEMLTATAQCVAPVIFVFHDGELGQIAQFQQLPLNRKTCTVLSDIKIEGVAIATGAKFFEIRNDSEISDVMDRAFLAAGDNRPVVVDVRIDYSKKTRFTQGVVKANLNRFPLGEKVRFIGRAVKRHLLG